MYCTGGIRCVKAGAFVRQKLGFTNVGRLEQGVVAYNRFLAANEEAESVFEGDNFVFDERVIEAMSTTVAAAGVGEQEHPDDDDADGGDGGGIGIGEREDKSGELRGEYGYKHLELKLATRPGSGAAAAKHQVYRIMNAPRHGTP